MDSRWLRAAGEELASLRLSSFRLDDVPPTLTVDATVSKHRRKDVLPMHPQLVENLRDWTKHMKPKDRLFPGLATKKLYRMIQLDLRDAGIPYQTEEGIADFHAAGRQTYITQLIRSGVSLPTAMELARHSDVKMTMRYTHIGIADQAAALASLPAAPQPVTPVAMESGCWVRLVQAERDRFHIDAAARRDRRKSYKACDPDCYILKWRCQNVGALTYQIDFHQVDSSVHIVQLLPRVPFTSPLANFIPRANKFDSCNNPTAVVGNFQMSRRMRRTEQ